MFHENSVQSLAFSSDSELLASGDVLGIVKLWKVKAGKCLRKIEGVFSACINCLKFNPVD
jgi:WD40 repeat protein